MAAGDNLLEAVTADTVANELKRARRHSLAVGTPCANCATPLAGPWCHICGQRGEEYHRSIWKLMWEAVEGLTDLDGRMWKTVPRLVLRPGKLTREYLEGRRASQIPPFRMFLIVLLLVFFAGGLAVDQNHEPFKLGDQNTTSAAFGDSMSPKDKAEFDKAMTEVRAKLSSNPVTAAAQVAAAKTAAADAARDAAKDTAKDVTPGKPPAPPAAKAADGGSSANVDFDLGKKNSKRAAWLKSQVQKAVKNPDAFYLAMQEWGHRGAVLMLPIAALMLTGLFAFRKGVYVFDHLIFAMHSLSFLGVLLSAIFLASIYVGGAWWLLWAAPVHLFVHMRGTYGSGVLGTLWRMWWLFIGTTIVVVALMVGLVFLGLAAVR
jgi:hypothetical protein